MASLIEVGNMNRLIWDDQATELKETHTHTRERIIGMYIQFQHILSAANIAYRLLGNAFRPPSEKDTIATAGAPDSYESPVRLLTLLT